MNANNDFIQKLLKSQMEVVTTLEEAQSSKKAIVYIATADGQLLQYQKTGVGEFVAKPKEYKALADVNEGFCLGLPKVPTHFLFQIVSFFRKIMEVLQNDEAMVQLYFHKPTQTYEVICPEQTTNKVHVTFIRDEYREVSEDYLLVADIHSHNNMSAFFSGTDDASEQETRLFGVFGELDKVVPAYKFRMGLGGSFHEIDLFDLFEKPTFKVSFGGTETEIDLPYLVFPDVDFPSEWVNTVVRGKEEADKFKDFGNPEKMVRKNKENSQVEVIDNSYFVENEFSPEAIMDPEEYIAEMAFVLSDMNAEDLEKIFLDIKECYGEEALSNIIDVAANIVCEDEE